MRVCGIKLTRDGADALVEGGWLAFCVEQEKRGNNPRYETVDNLDAIGAAWRNTVRIHALLIKSSSMAGVQC